MDRCEEVIAQKVEEEYVLATQRRHELLRLCGIAEEDLSKDGQLFLHVLSETAEILHLSEPTTSSYLMAMAELEDSLEDADRQARTARKAVGASRKRSQELLAELKDLENTQQYLEDAVEERERHENTTIMEQRTAESTERQRANEVELEALTTALQELEFDTVQDTIEHRNIKSLEDTCHQLEAENETLRAQLQQFHSLPLNADVAAAKLYEAQAELRRLEDNFSSQIKEML